MTDISNQEPDADEVARQLPGQIAGIRARIRAARAMFQEFEGRGHEGGAERTFQQSSGSHNAV
jgi:hypothetical protein